MRYYTKDHEWIEIIGDIGTVGITDHAQSQLGDIVFVELPDIGKSFPAGSPCCVVESVKAASDIYNPLAGTVTEVNDSVTTSPESINRDAANAWLYKIKLTSTDPSSLMTQTQYDQNIK